jgi:hypothetical protein
MPKPILQLYFSKFGLYIMAGLFKIPEDRALNKEFPDIETLTIKGVADLWRGGTAN